MGDISDIMGGEFKPDDIETNSGDFSPLPAGWYPAEIDTAVITDTKAGTGKYIKLCLTVIGENFANRKLFGNINIQNPNEICVEIGQRQLAEIGKACGLTAITSTDDLLGKTLQVKVAVREEKGYEPTNEMKSWKALGEQVAQPAPAEPTAPAEAPVAKADGMPWG